MSRIRRLVPVFLMAALAAACTTPRASRVAGPAPTPDSLPYPAGSDELVHYVAGYDQGYADYLAGRSSLNADVHYQSPEPRLHGYADGALRGLKEVGSEPIRDEPFRPHITSSSLPKIYERYGNCIESLPRPKLPWRRD